jgi:hypothetical protein
MILKLQRKTLLPLQILGYAITLCIGITIVLTTLNIYNDIKPILEEETDMFGNNAVVINKKITMLETGAGAYISSQGKGVNRSSIYFDKEDIEEFNSQKFVEKINYFNRASGFNIFLHIDQIGLHTDMFFESIPDEYLDIDSEDWQWDKDVKFIPIIIPKDYLKLLNFGYAETKKASHIPLLSYSSVKLVQGRVSIESSSGERDDFTCRIVGFSEKINSILVPDKFLLWANDKFGDGKVKLPSKLLVEFNDPSNPKIIEYLDKNNYEINEKELEFNKLINIFNIAFIFIFLIAIIIIILSVAFILLSINLIFQKNKEILRNLYNIGYNIKQISYFYKLIVNSITLISISLSVIFAILVRDIYSKQLSAFFEIEIDNVHIFKFGLIIAVVLLPLLNFMIMRRIKAIIKT